MSKEKAKRNSFQRVPLRLVLVVPFVLQVFTAVGLTGFFSIQNGQRAVNNLAADLRRSVSERIDDHLNQFILAGRQVAELNGKAIELNILDPEDPDQVGRYFWQQMQLYNLGYINLVSESGNFTGSGRFDRNRPVTIDLLVSQRFGDNRVRVYQTNQKGEPQKVNFLTNPFNFKQEQWYQRTVQEKRPVWNLFQWNDPPYHLSLAATYPVYDSNNHLKYISWTELRVWEISDFLRQLSVSRSGRAYIVEPNGLLVGSSAGEAYRLVGEKPFRLFATESKDPLIQASAQHLQKSFKSLSEIQSTQQIEFLENGQRQFLQVTPWRNRELNWLVVVAVPESDFMAEIQAYTRTTVFLCLGALGVAVVFGLYTSRWISRPIARLNEASKAIAAGRFYQKVYVNNVRELEDLATSFNQMAQQVCDSFEALEAANKKLEFSNVELEYRVHLRTQELSTALQDLQETQAQLIQTEKMSGLGQMMAGVAHEINNPINFIHGNLEHLKEYIEDLLLTIQLYQKSYPEPHSKIQHQMDEVDIAFILEDAPKIMKSMQEGTRRVREIVLTLRNFSRIDEVGKKHTDLWQGIDSTLLILQHRLKSQPFEIQIDKLYADIPLVECNAGQINQVFMNILANAIDAVEQRNRSMTPEYLEQSPGRIIIKAYSDRDKSVTVRIADNGTGMPESVRAKLFDPFFTTKPVGKGTGLGLSISYQIIVKQHGGKIDCVSKPGVGTEFAVTLPLVAKGETNDQSPSTVEVLPTD